jgi:putative NIF3 family GTP cyclohydrolase 1 type 2
MTITIQQAIDTIIAAVPGAPFAETVDTIKVGDASQELTGIIVTFLTTCEVIEQAAQTGANLIITHEPTFYSHPDETDWLNEHPVYAAKRRLLEENRIVVWRFHDYLHSIPPDNTFMGLLDELGWAANGPADNPFVCSIKPMKLHELIKHIQDQLGLGTIRVVGDLSMQCERVALLPGFPPAEWQMSTIGMGDADVLIAGEIHEWETSEYVRDANHFGFKKGLIVIGHAASEEPGMKRIIPWIAERIPNIPIRFVSSGSPFQYL